MTIDATVPVDNVLTQKSAMRANFAAIKAKIDGLPESYTGIAPGTVACVDDASSTLQVATQGTGKIAFADRQIGHFCPHEVPVGSNTSLTMAAHNGCALTMTNSAAVVLQLEKTSDPATGVQHLFNCSIARPLSGGAVQVTSTTLTNQNPSSHTRIAAGGLVTIWVNTTLNIYWFEGRTEA